MSLSKNINPSLVLVQPRKTRPYITEILLMGRKESNQTNKFQVDYIEECDGSVVECLYVFVGGGRGLPLNWIIGLFWVIGRSLYG